MITINNYIKGSFVAPSKGNYMNVENPANDQVIAKVGVSCHDDTDTAVKAAEEAFAAWSKMTIKARAAIMMKFHALVKENAQKLAEAIVKENGKNITEALADGEIILESEFNIHIHSPNDLFLFSSLSLSLSLTLIT
jgi:acyl-CoA reductase-like NAD-dependent aldehyde dehydrogenase